MNTKVAIIGKGGIAQHLKARLEAMGVSVCFSLGSNSSASYEELLKQKKPDAVFLAISTRDKGEAARDYILKSVMMGIPIITCEKGSLAFHTGALKHKLHLIGHSATVGGGTMMLPYLKKRNIKGPIEINAVVNGTLNFIFDKVSRGGTLGEACEEAMRLGYAEPGADTPLSLINGELGDVMQKICVVYNTVLAEKVCITPDSLGTFALTQDQLEEISKNAMDYRMLISFSNRSMPEQEFFNGHCHVRSVEGWYMQAGFSKVGEREEANSWLPIGVGNAIRIVEGELGVGGRYMLSGPGAGHEPTTSAMLADLNDLLKM